MRTIIYTAAVLLLTIHVEAQTIVDDSIIGTRYQPGLMQVFGKTLEDPRSIEIRRAGNGANQGVICGEMRFSKDSKLTEWSAFMADTVYGKLVLSSDNPDAKSKIVKACQCIDEIGRCSFK